MTYPPENIVQFAEKRSPEFSKAFHATRELSDSSLLDLIRLNVSTVVTTVVRQAPYAEIRALYDQSRAGLVSEPFSNNLFESLPLERLRLLVYMMQQYCALEVLSHYSVYGQQQQPPLALVFENVLNAIECEKERVQTYRSEYIDGVCLGMLYLLLTGSNCHQTDGTSEVN